MKNEIIEFETFRHIGNYEKNNLINNEPSCFNGDVRVTKFKVTIVELVEPKEIIEQRLQFLWDNCDNHHHWLPLKNKAKEIGYILLNNAGNNRKKQ